MEKKNPNKSTNAQALYLEFQCLCTPWLIQICLHLLHSLTHSLAHIKIAADFHENRLSSGIPVLDPG